MRLNQVTAPATDLAASIAFYELLGFKPIVRNDRYARFELPEGEATFSLELGPEAADGRGPQICFECDVDAEYARLAAVGVAFESAPETKRWLWREAHLRDPAGNRVILFHAGKNRRYPPWRLPETKGEALLHIVITRGGDVILTKQAGADWRPLQEEFADFMTSLGPFDAHEAMATIETEWPELFAARADEIARFPDSGAAFLKL